MSVKDTEWLEKVVVGALIEQPRSLPMFLELIDLTYLAPPTRFAAYAMADLVTDGIPVTALSVLNQLRQRGELTPQTATLVTDLLQLAHDLSRDVEYEMGVLADWYLLREASEAMTRLHVALPSSMPADWLALAQGELDRLVAVQTHRQPAVLTYLEDRLVGEDVSVKWCVPSLLPLGTATMLTAEEGVGKSVLLRQIAMSAMAGIAPFTPRSGTTYAPQRVVLIDCEVTNNQFIRSLRALWSYLHTFAPDADTKGMVVESRQGGLNFSDAHDQGWLHRIVRDHRADLVVVGPVYRFTDADLLTEEGVRTWQRSFEPLLAQGVTILTEHHVPNEQGKDVRSMRPFGSSAMRRWFAQGIGLRRSPCKEHETKWCPTCQRKAHVESWRGSRDEEARWPSWLTSVPGEVWWERDEAKEVEGSSNI